VGSLRGWLERGGCWSDEESGERTRSAGVAHVTERRRGGKREREREQKREGGRENEE